MLLISFFGINYERYLLHTAILYVFQLKHVYTNYSLRNYYERLNRYLLIIIAIPISRFIDVQLTEMTRTENVKNNFQSTRELYKRNIIHFRKICVRRNIIVYRYLDIHNVDKFVKCSTTYNVTSS